MNYYHDEEQVLNRLKVIKELISEQEIHTHPCPLMLSQLTDLRVLTGKLNTLTDRLTAITNKHLENL